MAQPHYRMAGPGDPVTWGSPIAGTNDPRLDDEDDSLLTREGAQEQAEDEARRTPLSFVCWLEVACSRCEDPADLDALARMFDAGQSLSTAGLIALVVNERDDDHSALRELVERYKADLTVDANVQSRVAELLGTQEREQQRLRDEAQVERGVFA